MAGQDEIGYEDAVVADGAYRAQCGYGPSGNCGLRSGCLGLDAAADVYAFLEVIEIPYGEGCTHSRPVPEILRFRADGGAVTDAVVATHPGGAVDAYAALDDTARPDAGPTLDDEADPHQDGRVELDDAFDDGGWMDAYG